MRRARAVRRRPTSHRTAVAASTAAGFAAVLALHANAGAPATLVAPSGSTTTTAPGTSPPSSTAIRSAVGTDEQYGYGSLAVKVTVRGAQILDVAVVNLQTAESYSQSLAEQVIPMLRNEVLSAQSTTVNGFSGATYTTQAYLQSLQSALDTLHA